MNNLRRMAIGVVNKSIAELQAEMEGGSLSQIMEYVETFRDEEQEYRDNMPESIGDGEKGDTADEAIEHLQEAYDKLEELQEAINNLNDAMEELEEAQT